MQRLPDAFALAMHLALGIDDLGLNAEERQRRRARLESRGAGKRGDQDAAGFGLPPGVDDRAAARSPTTLIVPLPGFRVDRFADASRAA